MVRWSTSWDARGRHASTRAASLAQVPTSGQPAASRARTSSTSRSRGTSTSRQSRSAPGCSSSAGPYRVPPDGRGRPRVAPGDRLVGRALGVDRLADGGPVVGRVGDLDPQHELHAVQPGGQRDRRLGEQPGGLAVVDDARRVLDVPLRAEHQQLGRRPRRQRGQLLRGDRVQPGQPVRAGDGDDAEVRLVDHGAAAATARAARRSGRRSARRRRRRARSPGPRRGGPAAGCCAAGARRAIGGRLDGARRWSSGLVVGEGLDAREAARGVGLHGVAERGDVVRPHELAVDQAVEALAGADVGAGGGARRSRR